MVVHRFPQIVRVPGLVLVLLLVLLAPGGAARAESSAGAVKQNPTPAPCYVAAMAALTKQGAIYSQGGALAGDPIDPATGAPYPRTGPDSFDCSGLVWWSYVQAGITIGTTTHAQINNGTAINCDLSQLDGENTTCWTLGDLVFLRYEGGQHVAIYVGRGLFMDCYNQSVGCVLHNIANDSFYLAHFWQARRIASGCEGMTNDPGQPTTSPPSGVIPDLEEIPALLAPVWLRMPWQCNGCDASDNAPVSLVPMDDPEVRWYDLGSWFNWLGVQLWNRIALPIICWMLAIAQGLLNALSDALNVFIDGINGFWRLAIRFAIWTREAFFALWGQVAWLRSFAWGVWLWMLAGGATGIEVIIGLVRLLGQFGELAGLLVEQVGELAAGIAQALAYLLALFVSLVPALIDAVVHPVAPPEIAALSDFFLLVWTRETLQAIADSRLWWAWTAFIGLFYARFVLWLLDEMASLNT